MESGPLPPHERSWRHPSELGPTRVDVDAGPQSHVAVLAAGALAVLAVAAMVVVMTPRPTGSPVAISVTTSPVRPATVASSPGPEPRAARSVSLPSNPAAPLRVSSGVLLTTFASYPHAITSAPQPDLDGTDVADDVPGRDDIVYLRTEDVTYRLQWDLVSIIDVPDGSVVFDDDGDILARVADGEVLTLVDD